MGRRLILAAVCVCVLVAVLALVAIAVRWPVGEPLGDMSGRLSETGLPPGSIVINAASCDPTAPFAIESVAGSAMGRSLVLSQGKGDKEHCQGQAAYTVSIPESGRYTVWLRVRWEDGCGNSISLRYGADAQERVVGQDAVFGVWHWISVGLHDEPKAPCERVLTLGEREDGVAVDQILLVRDTAFMPSGPLRSGSVREHDFRRFADSFDRSPGHGCPDWEFRSGAWGIEFSLDPNRIPNQYSLHGKASAGQMGVALLRGLPWRGLRFSCCVRVEPGGRCGLMCGPGSKPPPAPGADAGTHVWCWGGGETGRAELEPGQWHRVVVERWAWRTRLSVDGRVVWSDDNSPAAPIVPALAVTNGTVFFDDVSVEELLWEADDGGELRLPWRQDSGRWRRLPSKGVALQTSGPGVLRLTGLPHHVHDTMLQGEWGGSASESPLSVAAVPPDTATAPELRLQSTSGLTVNRFALCYSAPVADVFRIGPYEFSSATVADPGDYADFTPEEVARTQAAGNADLTLRRPKAIPLVGKRQYSIWEHESGTWDVFDGALKGLGRGASVRLWQILRCDLTASLRVRLPREGCQAFLMLQEREGKGCRFLLGGEASEDGGELHLPVPADGDWHEVEVSLSGEGMSGSVDGGAVRSIASRGGQGGGIVLGVARGQAEFDDVSLFVPRRTSRQSFHAFDRREPEWRRTGGVWREHGGIACALASNWISLETPEGEGMLWHRTPVSGDVRVAFNIEENTEWHGWEQEPSHTHHPFDNVRVCLSPEASCEKGVLFEINADGRTATLLRVAGAERARVAQNWKFPIQYAGGHAPYRPRRNRIELSRRGARVALAINGIEVLASEIPELGGDAAARPLHVGIGGHRTQVNFSRILIVHKQSGE